MQISAVPRHSDGKGYPKGPGNGLHAFHVRLEFRALRSLRESLDVNYGRVNTSPFVTGLVVLR